MPKAGSDPRAPGLRDRRCSNHSATLPTNIRCICKKILPGDWPVNVAQSSTDSLIPLLRWAKTFNESGKRREYTRTGNKKKCVRQTTWTKHAPAIQRGVRKTTWTKHAPAIRNKCPENYVNQARTGNTKDVSGKRRERSTHRQNIHQEMILALIIIAKETNQSNTYKKSGARYPTDSSNGSDLNSYSPAGRCWLTYQQL